MLTRYFDILLGTKIQVNGFESPLIFFYILFLLFCLPSLAPAQVCIKHYASPSAPLVCEAIINLTDCKKCDADCNEVPNTRESPLDECMKCSVTGVVRNIDKIKAHNDGLADSILNLKKSITKRKEL